MIEGTHTRRRGPAAPGLAVLVACLVAVAPTSARTHAGHDHTVKGTVAAIEDDRLDVRELDGETTTFLVNEQTKILRGRAPASLADIEIGERIVVIGAVDADAAHEGPAADDDEMMTAKEVRLASR